MIGIHHGRRQRGQADSCPALPATLPPRKNFDSDKVPFVHFNMIGCKLSNVIFAKKHRYLCFFAFSNIKNRHSLHVQKLKVFQLQGALLPDSLTRAQPRPGFCPWTLLHFSMHTTNKGRHLLHTPKKFIAPVALLSFRFLAPPMLL